MKKMKILNYSLLALLIVTGLSAKAEAQTYSSTYTSNGGSYYPNTGTGGYVNTYIPSLPPVHSYDPGVPTGSVSTSPHDGVPGEQVVVSGSAFNRNSAIVIYFAGIAVGRVVSDSNGSFSTVIRVPNVSAGLVTVTATGIDPYNPPTFLVNAPAQQTQTYWGNSGYVTAPSYGNTYTATVINAKPSYTSQARTAEITALRIKISQLQQQLSNLLSQLNTLTQGY
ncbi:MAG: hypothetical protein JWN18_439 [Parcubacteria group bacterium]|nr:hypothetical protein [Parcubacteria group bacterium]